MTRTTADTRRNGAPGRPGARSVPRPARSAGPTGSRGAEGKDGSGWPGTVQEAEAYVYQEARRTEQNPASRWALPAIRALCARVEGVRRAEVERALRRMPDVSDGQADVIEAMSRAIVEELVAAPISFLRANNDHAGDILDAFDLQMGGTGTSSRSGETSG